MLFCRYQHWDANKLGGNYYLLSLFLLRIELSRDNSDLNVVYSQQNGYSFDLQLGHVKVVGMSLGY